MKQNETKFRWTQAKVDAAALVAEDRLTDEEIAARVGSSRPQLWRWQQHPEFAARVDKIIARMDAAASRKAIARKGARIAALNDRWSKMLAVIEDRACDPEMAAARGGDTGLLVKQRRCVGGGDNAEFVDEFSVDTGLLKEIREHEKQAAQEMGQWTQQHEHRGGIIHAHLFAGAAKLAEQPDELDRQYRAAIGPPAADWDEPEALGT
jgi:hypothetical protein